MREPVAIPPGYMAIRMDVAMEAERALRYKAACMRASGASPYAEKLTGMSAAIKEELPAELKAILDGALKETPPLQEEENSEPHL